MVVVIVMLVLGVLMSRVWLHRLRYRARDRYTGFRYYWGNIGTCEGGSA